ncbi:tetratricopeptide repeat protein [Anaerolineales bacterium HSG6]|nr:tetratricopeptide repeat protein [Anaerolineales bacterium HSG6]MDM8531915.1 tetratricopeptide repeat protein [Anaerolineales bacterium HSG25]
MSDYNIYTEQWERQDRRAAKRHTKKRLKPQPTVQKEKPVNYKPALMRLAEVNALKGEIVADFNRGSRGSLKKAYRKLNYLRENQADRPDLFAKSLSDINRRIFDRHIQLELLAKAITYNPNDSVTLTSYGTALAQAGQLEKSFEMFEASITVNPSESVTLNSYGTALAQAGQFEKSFEMFEASITVNPENSVTLTSYGTALAQAGQLEKSFEMFEASITVNPSDSVTLNSYGTALAQEGQLEKAFEMFEASLTVNPSDSVTLTSYGMALAQSGQLEKSFEMIEASLTVNPSDSVTLTSYGTALAETGQLEKAFEMFEASLTINPSDSVTLTSYGIALIEADQYDEAFKMFEASLTINPFDSVTLTSYGTALIEVDQYDEAFKMFEASLAINLKNSLTLNSYGTALAQSGQLEKSFEMFEASLTINPESEVALNNYGKALVEAGRYDEAFEMFEFSLQVDAENGATLTGYGTALAQAGRFEEAFKQFESSLQIDASDSVTLTSYGTALAQAGRFEEAFKQFESSLQVDAYDGVTLVSYAAVLEQAGNYEAAIVHLERVDTKSYTDDQTAFIYLTLGRLYYFTRAETLGNKYFDRAITLSSKQDAALLYAAQSILVKRPFSAEAMKRLKQITQQSPRYAQAQRMLSLNLVGEAFYDQFNVESDDELTDTQEFHKIIYHKMNNQVNLLRLVIEEIELTPQATENSRAFLTAIKQGVRTILAGIKERRQLEKKIRRDIPTRHYHEMIELISKTAHDITDFVNNKLFGLRTDVQEFLKYELIATDPFYPQLEQVLAKIRVAERGLNDLKSINQGIKIRPTQFKVQELFDPWQDLDRLDHAKIWFDVTNGNSEFYGDRQKIISFLSELIENSLRHNAGQPDLEITITSRDVVNPVIQSKTIPDERQYLYLSVRDNGVGIPADKKQWAFLPLKTTSDQGSGLGLFIIKRTLQKMGGQIEEVGQQGVHFKIHIPYKTRGEL